MYEIVTSIYYSTCRGNRNIRINFKNTIHRLSDYRNLPLDGTSETKIFAKSLEFFWS